VNPIKVYFTVGEPQYLAWRKRFPTESSRLQADKELRLQPILADGATYADEGRFYFADRQVNESTGAIRIAGLFPNPNNVLRPGGYAKVRAVIRTQPGALLVPQRAVSELQGGGTKKENPLDAPSMSPARREQDSNIVDPLPSLEDNGG
jgi:multidrug efflux pump subunit AcrA (membrane-fusion protein)